MISEVSVNFNFGRLSDKLESIIDKYINDDFAEQVVKASKEKIKSGKVTPVLKQSTIKIREKRGTGGSRPLYETGALHDSIKKTSDGIQMAGYGGKHLKGYTTVKKSMIPRKKVKKRNFIEIPKASADGLEKDMLEALILQPPIVLKVGGR
jgi:hypothetical protein|tara:strand:- start:642 stop:1094 length:453 start_codon:yes stop_codon:yes gene_type:complete